MTAIGAEFLDILYKVPWGHYLMYRNGTYAYLFECYWL